MPRFIDFLGSPDTILVAQNAPFDVGFIGVDLIRLGLAFPPNLIFDTKLIAQALLPLLRGTIRNIDTIGIPQCLTGPIARGDTGTIKKHLSALQKVAPAVLSTYRELGLQTIPIALAKGRIDKNQAKELETILKQSD